MDAAEEDTGYEKDAHLVLLVKYQAPAKGRLQRKAVNFWSALTTQFWHKSSVIHLFQDDRCSWGGYYMRERYSTQDCAQFPSVLFLEQIGWLRGGVKSKQIMATKISHFVVLAFLFNPDCQKRLEQGFSPAEKTLSKFKSLSQSRWQQTTSLCRWSLPALAVKNQSSEISHPARTRFSCLTSKMKFLVQQVVPRNLKSRMTDKIHLKSSALQKYWWWR